MAPVDSGILGTWNTYDLEGTWTLRLTALDRAGNKTEKTSRADLGERLGLVKAFGVEPKVFSPNGDGKLDSAAINFELTAAGQVSLQMLSATDVVIFSKEFTSSSGEAVVFFWDGNGQDGELVPDGDYQIRLVAHASDNPNLTQVETLSVTVDTLAPRISITDPVEDSYHTASSLNIVGAIDEESLTGYSISYSGPAGDVALSEGNQVPTGSSLGDIKGLRDGNYILVVEAGDAGGNETRLERAFSVDLAPPVLALESPTENSFMVLAIMTSPSRAELPNPTWPSINCGMGWGSRHHSGMIYWPEIPWAMKDSFSPGLSTVRCLMVLTLSLCMQRIVPVRKRR